MPTKPTPKTDEAIIDSGCRAGIPFVMVSFARQLETENAELLEDVRPLVEAAKTLKAAKGRHNTGIAYERFLEAVNQFTAKYPLN